jgi:tol-pal system protein YbgF
VSRRGRAGEANGGLGVARVRRLARRAVGPLAIAVLGAGLTGCATKRDIRDIRGDLDRLEARQDSIFRLLQSQNREILDSLTVTTERLLNVRGELANQLTRLQEQLVQVGELTGQVQIRLNQLDQELAGAVREVSGSGGPPSGGQAGPPSGGADPGMAQEIYDAGLEQVNRGNAATARRAFQMIVDSFPDHPAAPEAQRQLGETYVMEQQFDRALRAFDRVVERYPDSDAAPRALYRAGVIAQERGQNDRARDYFRRVISAYPASDARRLAESALERM